jgi:hypothetical protein
MTDFYFADDGNWGDASGLTVIEDGSVDDHFWGIASECHDNDRNSFAFWFKNNDHDKEETAEQYGFSMGVCAVCDKWQDEDSGEEDTDE